MSIGVTFAEQLRDLATTIDRHGISVTQCAQGYRVDRLLNSMGIDEDNLKIFLGETYNRCVGIGVSPEDIGRHLKDLVSFTIDNQNLGIKRNESGGEDGDNGDDNGDDEEYNNVHEISHPIPSILQIAKYLERRKEEYKKSELKYQQLKNETKLLEAKKSSITQLIAEKPNDHHITAEKLDWYMDIKAELLASGHSDNDYELILKGIKLVKENGYNFLEIASQISEHEKLKLSISRLRAQHSFMEGKIAQLQDSIKVFEEAVESKSQLLWHMVKLEKMGFGLKQLSRLYNIIKEINEANGFSEADDYAVKIFI